MWEKLRTETVREKRTKTKLSIDNDFQLIEKSGNRGDVGVDLTCLLDAVHRWMDQLLFRVSACSAPCIKPVQKASLRAISCSLLRGRNSPWQQNDGKDRCVSRRAR